MPLILGTNSIKDTSFDVANSLRFNSGSSDHLNRSTSSGDRLKWTWSAWLKKTKNGADEDLFSGYDNSSNFTRIQIGDTGRFNYINKTSGTQNAKIETNRVFRDNSAWYNFVIVWDTGNATAGNRMRIYINGVEETSFANETQPSLNQVSHVNQASKTNYVGTFDGSGTFFNGYMAEVVLIDGQALDPTSFGEFDEDSPTIWKPKDVSGLTFGTNGFYLDFEDGSSLGNDAAGSNNFTVNNLTAIDQSTDTCTNNFATLNPLTRTIKATVPTISEGNLKGVNSSNATSNGGIMTTISTNVSKWYWEAKVVNNNHGVFGITLASNNTDQDSFGGIQNITGSYAIYGNSGRKFVNGTGSADSFTFSTDDILMCAMDLDNNYVYFGKNGTWYNSGDPTSGSSGTNAFSSFTNNYYLPFMANNNGNFASGFSFNFGSPAYAISSGNSDGEGFGNFEYAPPSGYFSLCTKNLAEYG